MTPAQLRALDSALQSPDAFAVARLLHPGGKFIRFVDRRSRGNLGHTFVAVLKPGSAWHDMAPDTQTVVLNDVIKESPA